MTGRRETDEEEKAPSPAERRRAAEKARLAEALRENLRRRKEQARKRTPRETQ